MILTTSRFGNIRHTQEQVFDFPEGIIGFYEKRRFLVLQHKPGSPFRWLQSADDGELAFLMVDPSAFTPGYAPDFLKADLEALRADSAQELQAYAVVVVPEDPRKMYANLLGPIVVNSRSRLGRQIILSNGKYTTCHYIVDELKNSCGAAYAGAVKETE